MVDSCFQNLSATAALLRMNLCARSFRAAFVLATSCATACHQAPAPVTPEIADVAAMVVQPSSLPLPLTFAAHAAGSREVEVRARVSGILLARRFEEGKPVVQNQILFQIDPEPARAALAQVQAELAMQRAQYAQAKRESDRIAGIFAKGLVSQAQRDQAMSTTEIADANRLAAEARLRKAELDLSYTQVRAPIAGLASNEARSEGSLVTAGSESSLLTRIVQADPLYVEFTVPDYEAVLLRTGMVKMQSLRSQQITARIELADGTLYPETAQLTFLDNAVEAQSGSVAARAIVRNPKRALLPGQFVRVHIEGLRIDDVIGLPRKSVLTNSDGYFVWVLGDKNKVEQRHIALGTTVGDQVIVKSGLRDGDRVVIDGVMKVAAGDRVNVSMSTFAGAALAGASEARVNSAPSMVKSIE